MKQDFAGELNRDEDDIHAEIFGDDLPPLPKRQPEIIEVIPDGAIVPAEHGWLYRHFELTPVGVQIADGTSESEWLDLGAALFKLGSAIQWLLGDWLAFGERRYKKTYEEIAAATGYEVKTLYNYSYVSKSVNFSLRKEKLSFGHHNLVAGFAPRDQLDWLEKAAIGKWSISQMRKEISRWLNGDPPPPPTPREKLENAIVASRHEMAVIVLDAMNDPATVRSARELIAEAIQYFKNLDQQLRG